jgi:hypothetical protein
MYALLVFLAWTAVPLFCWGIVKLMGGGISQAGQFGDTFGIVNSLFSGLAMLGALVAILLQQAEIRRTELEQEAEAAARQEGLELQALSTLVSLLTDSVGINRDKDKETAREHIVAIRGALTRRIRANTKDSFLRVVLEEISAVPSGDMVEVFEPVSVPPVGPSPSKPIAVSFMPSPTHAGSIKEVVRSRDKSPIKVGDIVREFSKIQGLDREDIVRVAATLRSQLNNSHIVTNWQLSELVSDSQALEAVRKIYVSELGRPAERPLDPMAVAAWVPPLYLHGCDPGVLEWIRTSVRSSSEYKNRQKHH